MDDASAEPADGFAPDRPAVTVLDHFNPPVVVFTPAADAACCALCGTPACDMLTDSACVACERDKLLAFKNYVHRRLDEAGVSADPESPHKQEGCRVGGRLDEVFRELDRLRNECAATARLLNLIQQYKDDPATLREWGHGIGIPWVDALVAERNELRVQVELLTPIPTPTE